MIKSGKINASQSKSIELGEKIVKMRVGWVWMWGRWGRGI